MEREDDVAPVAAWFEEHCGFVWRSLRHFGVDEAALDDAVQDVFITAHRRWASFEGRSTTRTWLFGITRRIAHRYRRSARARSQRFVPAETTHEPAEHPMDRLHAAHSLASMIGRLDREKRAVFVLSEIEGMTAPEVAQALGIPLGTAYSRLRAAWQVLGRAAGHELRRGEVAQLRPEPSEASRRRMWSAIAIGTAPMRTAVAVGIASQLKWLAAGAALGVGLLTVGAAALPEMHSDPPGATTPSDREPAAPAEPVVAVVARAPTIPESHLEPDPAAAAPASPPPRADRARSDTSTSDPRAELAEELRLVGGAQAAVRERRSADAIVLLDEHARRFPDGQLAAERRSTRVTALCLAGRHADAEVEARALGRARPACE
jgi:RNA polymerase sigma-70 factor (ECF subfamily)